MMDTADRSVFWSRRPARSKVAVSNICEPEQLRGHKARIQARTGRFDYTVREA
jgi:hypothetical protein